MASVYRNERDGGASMRGSYKRLANMTHPDHFGGDASQTEDLGPGAYEDHLHNALATSLQKRTSRSSKLKPAFGTNSKRGALPHGMRDESPGPGEYQPEVWGGPYAERRKAMRARSRATKTQMPRPATAR